MKPILKIKRNTNFTPPTNSLSSGELAVDLGTNTLYVGSSTGVSVPIAAEVSYDSALGGLNSSDNKIVSQKAARDYLISGGFLAGTQDFKDNLIATRTYYPVSTGTSIEPIDFSGFTIQQTANLNLQISEPFQTGLIQTVKNEMFLNVNYSAHITSIDNNAIITEGTTVGYWRFFALRVIDTLVGPSTAVYYATQIKPPAIGDTTPVINPLPTLISGNAIIKLPKYISGSSEWELQLVYRVRSVDLSMDIGTGGWNQGINDPIISSSAGIRLQIVKLSESIT